jgi:hypothetical protein
MWFNGNGLVVNKKLRKELTISFLINYALITVRLILRWNHHNARGSFLAYFGLPKPSNRKFFSINSRNGYMTVDMGGEKYERIDYDKGENLIRRSYVTGASKH